MYPKFGNRNSPPRWLSGWILDSSNHCLHKSFHFKTAELLQSFCTGILTKPHSEELQITAIPQLDTCDIEVDLFAKTSTPGQETIELASSIENSYEEIIDETKRDSIWSWFKNLG
jgi:hypothetical protein